MPLLPRSEAAQGVTRAFRPDVYSRNRDRRRRALLRRGLPSWMEDRLPYLPEPEAHFAFASGSAQVRQTVRSISISIFSFVVRSTTITGILH